MAARERVTALIFFRAGLSSVGLPKSFADNFSAMLDRRRLSNRSVARKAGISESEISEYKTGSGGMPILPRLLRIAFALNCSVDDLLEGMDADYDAARSDLTRHELDQQSGTSSHVGASPNDPAAARVFVGNEELRLENERLRTALEKITHVASDLIQIAKAGVEVNSAVDEGSGGSDSD